MSTTPEPEVTYSISWAELLSSTPPRGKVFAVPDLAEQRNGTYYIAEPELQLHCDSESCNGLRFFTALSGDIFASMERTTAFIRYGCRNCGRKIKMFAFIFYRETPTKEKS
jgi:hypothetical protein